MQYEVRGGNLPYIVCQLSRGESLVAETGAMSWFTENIAVETKGRGGLGKMMGRMFSGESMFQNIYSAAKGDGEIAFASKFPGTIHVLELHPGEDFVIQKGAFLASERSVQSEVFFQKKLSAGFFGGEGFIMQRVFGQGAVFLEVDGALEEKVLASGERFYIDTGYLLGMDSSCTMQIEATGNVKSMMFGGEGFFNTVVEGPGRVWLQSMPIAQLAGLFQMGGASR